MIATLLRYTSTPRRICSIAVGVALALGHQKYTYVGRILKKSLQSSTHTRFYMAIKSPFGQFLLQPCTVSVKRPKTSSSLSESVAHQLRFHQTSTFESGHRHIPISICIMGVCTLQQLTRLPTLRIFSQQYRTQQIIRILQIFIRSFEIFGFRMDFAIFKFFSTFFTKIGDHPSCGALAQWYGRVLVVVWCIILCV